MKNKQYTIPIFVPHLGCPFDCVFCNQDRITGHSTNVTGKDVEKIIEEYLGYFTRRDSHIEVGFFGGSFTGIKPEIQRELLSVAYKYKKAGKIQGIRLSTRPDFINPKILELLKEYSVDTVELGVQSLDEDVLSASGRGHTGEVVYRAAEMIKESGINLGLQMMVGLPGDSYEKSLNTVEEFIKLDPFCVRIYPTLVIKDTELEEKYKSENYKALGLDQAVESVSEYLMRFEEKDINVIRLGLQPTENIQLGKDVVAGPFHPSFGQLVKSDIYIKLFEAYIDSKGLDLEGKELTIYANPRDISLIAGQKSVNRERIRLKYRPLSISFKPKLMKEADLLIKIDKEEYYMDYIENIRKYIKN